MSSLHEIVVILCDNKGWQWQYEKAHNTVVFEVPLSEGTRKQVCIARLVPSQVGNIIEIISRIGECRDDLDLLKDLLKYNQKLLYGRTQLDPEAKTFYLVARTSAELANAREVELMAIEIANQADNLEELYFQADNS